MDLTPARAWVLAAPLMLLTALGVVLPFAWRSAVLLADCAQAQAGCAWQELVADDYYLQALLNTLLLALGSSLIGLAIGLGAALWACRRPRLQGPLQLLASLGANLAGVPLALALLLLLGSQGVITVGLRALGWDAGIDLDRLSGLMLAYLCFQAPLAFLLLLAPVQMQDRQLPEAAAVLGASAWRHGTRVGLPLLAPSLLDAFALLFANAAAAFATPFALSGTAAHVLAVRLAALVSGDLFAQPELAALLALGLFGLLVGVIGLCKGSAAWLRRRWGL